MIMDMHGNSADFARHRGELAGKVSAALDRVIERHLGRKPHEGEVESKGVQMVHPNGNVTFCWEKTPLMRLLFGRNKITMEDLI